MAIADDIRTFHLQALPYPQNEIDDIMAQAAEYQLVKDSTTQGGGYRKPETSHRLEDVDRRSIIVKNGRFAGVFTCGSCKAETFLHLVYDKEFYGILFADGTTAGINREEFEGNPGGFRYSCDYSLEKRS